MVMLKRGLQATLSTILMTLTLSIHPTWFNLVSGPLVFLIGRSAKVRLAKSSV